MTTTLALDAVGLRTHDKWLMTSNWYDTTAIQARTGFLFFGCQGIPCVKRLTTNDAEKSVHGVELSRVNLMDAYCRVHCCDGLLYLSDS